MKAMMLLMLLVAQVPGPAAIAVDQKTCGQHAADYTLVRNDILAVLNDADKNLPSTEAALARAQLDLRALKVAADELQGQKTVLLDHVKRLESVIEQQKAICELTKPGVGDVAAEVWEWADAPLAFAAGASMCVGLAWGLNEVTR